MIDIKNGELTDLWPDETSAEFKSISYAMHMAIMRLLEKAAGVGSSCDIDHLEESTLDYLAVEMRAMYYDQDADIETKRSIIKNTLKWYSRAGTPQTVAELVTVVFGEGSVNEWFEYGGDPYTFKIKTSAAITGDNIDYFTKMIKRVKNTRSRLEAVEVDRTTSGTTYFGASASSAYIPPAIKEGYKEEREIVQRAFTGAEQTIITQPETIK